jgi:hypothetical protein
MVATERCSTNPCGRRDSQWSGRGAKRYRGRCGQPQATDGARVCRECGIHGAWNYDDRISDVIRLDEAVVGRGGYDAARWYG